MKGNAGLSALGMTATCRRRTERRRDSTTTWATIVLALTGLCFVGCTSTNRAEPEAPQAFSRPDDAVQALTDALRADDTGRLLTIMGSQSEPLVRSEDQVADRQRRQKFLALYDQKHSLVSAGPDQVTLVVGNSDWPFPIPIVQRNGGWVFDAAAGREEILNRRIGENELSAIQVCEAIGDAEQEFALRDPDGDGVHEYASRFASDPGKRNGLYWPASAGEQPSPLGELAAQAAAEGYTRRAEGPTPYHGYYYRILQAQGPHAPDGALDYVVKDKLILGFAVVAYPAEYGTTGVMTFIMGPDGMVYQKDLGPQTAELGKSMKAFDPGQGWAKVDQQANERPL